MVYGPSNPSWVKHSSKASSPPGSRSWMWCFLGMVPKVNRSIIAPLLDPARGLLVALDALEQRAEVPRAEPLVTLALDDLVEEWPGVPVAVEAGRVLHEDLEQVAVLLVSVDQDAEPPEVVRALVDAADAEHLQPLAELVVVAVRGVHELDRAGPQHALDRGDDLLHTQGQVLDALAAVVLDEDVDLRGAEVRPGRLVVGELHARLRVPHHRGPQARALVQLVLRVVGVKLDLPEPLQPQHLLHPQDRRHQRTEIGRDVVDAVEAEPVLPTGGLLVEEHPREERPVPVTLGEAEGGVAERGGDGEPAQRSAPRVPNGLNVLHEGGPSAVQEVAGLLHVLHRKGERSHPVRMLRQPSRGATALALRLAHHQDDVASLEHQALLLAARGEIGIAPADLLEVHPLRVEAAAALEIAHVPVRRFDSEESEGFFLGHDVGSLLARRVLGVRLAIGMGGLEGCLLYTSDAADE